MRESGLYLLWGWEMTTPIETESVKLVRTFGNGRQLGVGFDRTAYFVFDREKDGDPWQKHCGPYSTFEQGQWWCDEIRDDHAKV